MTYIVLTLPEQQLQHPSIIQNQQPNITHVYYLTPPPPPPQQQRGQGWTRWWTTWCTTLRGDFSRTCDGNRS
ncbi:hypothetical protein HCN44_009987 [Aphidius gifuensis]|uniref:Uncharacterized protein n=1 Tax=Aphidius gifuensis TaxID=684658 RepID=A0A834Y1F0_APHGI|nr:hypothetical protein HCN44_009981 [Aphidius gifuensis]KAF7996106.1 hypothetical protein HCN44_009987 [Aphidius gifuensis]